MIARFCQAARLAGRVRITGDGVQTRDFVYVADVARANVAALTADRQGHHVVDVTRSCAAVARLRDILGLSCSTCLRDGLSAQLTCEQAPERAGSEPMLMPE